MRLDPEKRCRKIDDLLERIHNNGRCRALLQKWGITLEEKLVTLQSRELEPEKLTGYATAWYTGERAEWSRIMRNSVAFRPVDLHYWVVITPNTYMAKNLAIQFIEEVKHLGESMRIDINYPMLQLCGDTKPNSYRNALLEAMQRAADHPIRMVVILLPDDSKTLYDLLKLWLCTETDIPSQCVQLSTLRGHLRDGCRSKNFTAIIDKIVLQMICKMGGALWKVNIPARPHDNRADLGTNLRCFIKIPQHVNQGTVTPVCYNVIYDDTGPRLDQHHRLAFKLSHLYYNWQSTVRVPAPCQYAHKLAFIVAQSIQTNVEENINVKKELRNKLFFL